MKNKIKQMNIIRARNGFERIDVIKTFLSGGRILCLAKQECGNHKYGLYDYKTGMLVRSLDTQRPTERYMDEIRELLENYFARFPEPKTINSEKIEKGMSVCRDYLPKDPEEREGFVIQMKILANEDK